MTKDINENMTRYTIQLADGWQKIASSGDTVAIQSAEKSEAILQVVDAKPSDAIDWGFELRGNTQEAFVVTHDVYARAMRARIVIIVQKD